MTRMGKAVLRRARRRVTGLIKGLHCQVRSSMKRSKYICPLPAGQYHHFHELRLRRQRAPGQEVLRPAHCLQPGPAGGLDGGAHAHPRHRESPAARSSTSAAAFPSACGKTNLAMLIPPEGLQQQGLASVWCVGDDIAWLRIGTDGRLWAVQPRERLLRRRARHLP